jgi:hypothetical protein
MGQMAFKTSIRQKELATGIVSSAVLLADDTRRVLAEKLARYLREGETMPDAGVLQELLARYLADQSEQLIAVDHEYNAEARQVRLLRLRQLEAMAKTRSVLRHFRVSVEQVFGREACKTALGTCNFTSRDPGMLAALARQAALYLRQPEHRFEPHQDLKTVDTDLMVATLERVAEELSALAAGELLRRRARRGLELDNKAAQLAVTKTAISEVAGLLKGLLTFAGKGIHARRLRPSHRKKGGGEADPSRSS